MSDSGGEFVNVMGLAEVDGDRRASVTTRVSSSGSVNRRANVSHDRRERRGPCCGSLRFLIALAAYEAKDEVPEQSHEPPPEQVSDDRVMPGAVRGSSGEHVTPPSQFGGPFPRSLPRTIPRT